MLNPPKLKPGDRVRFVSPASTPERDALLRRAAVLEGWGLCVEYGEHAFAENGYLAGNDDQRAADLNAALRDPDVRAVFATRGGRGSYRIADRIDFEAVERDPKFLVGFSDITILHLTLWKRCRLAGVHGTVMAADEGLEAADNAALRAVLMGAGRMDILSRPEEVTAALTTRGTAQGRLIGGNLDMIGTAAGWALPDLSGAILLMEAVEMRLGQVDRLLTMLRKSGHLDGIAGIAVGQFTKCSRGVVDVVLPDHLHGFGVPVLGGLPLGHGDRPLTVPLGTEARLDAEAGTLTVIY